VSKVTTTTLCKQIYQKIYRKEYSDFNAAADYDDEDDDDDDNKDDDNDDVDDNDTNDNDEWKSEAEKVRVRFCLTQL
jgi:hypothetical protein